ncbi:MAG: hypothetical protein MJ252_15095 [archaeon]|nr:hypothetical protein [archaeon]
MLNGARQPLEGSTEKEFVYNLNDATLGEEYVTLNWLVCDSCEIALRFRIHEKKSLLAKAMTMSMPTTKTEVKPQSETPLIKNKSFADKLKFFQNVKKETAEPKKASFGPATNKSSNEALKDLNPNLPDKMEKTAQEEKILKSVSYGEVEKEIPKISKLMTDCFCEGFFISSFPKTDGKVIEKSQEYKSICGHELCSMLPAMQPEIVARYPLKDTKTLELNDLAASICFPSGIKICYGGNEGQEDEAPPTVKNYSSPITNQQGERYYMMNYHFYYKMLNGEFTKQYEVHPLKHHMHKFAEGYLGLEIDKATEKKIQQNLEICQDFNFKDFVYVPYCITLISKFPYIKQLEKCIQSIYGILSDFSSQHKINDIIQFLVHSLPVPQMGTCVKFYMPFYSFPIQITCPKVQDINIITNNLTSLLDLFTLQNIITIFRLMLFEKKILFIGKDYSLLSEVTDSFISLIYPLQWIHTYIPIMSDQMIQYLQTFLPFINGIHETLLPFVQETLVENEDEVFMVYIDCDEVKRKPKSRIDLNRNLLKKKINVDDKM